MIPLKFPLGRNLDFITLLSLPLDWPKDQEEGNALMNVERLFFPPADHTAQIIVKGVRRNKIAAIKTTKKETIETCLDAIEESLVELSFVKHNVLQLRASNF